MAQPKALTPEQESEARGLLASGTTARAIARRFGVDHKTITKIGGPKCSDPPDVGLGEARDDFERAQMATYERLRARINARGKRAPSDRDLPTLAKAMNDTIKAIRVHRTLTKQSSSGSDESQQQAAERVRARLEATRSRLEARGVLQEARGPVVAPVAAEEKTGT